MPEVVLQGPNGGPAIDEMTGAPLTMEEMLRRRGILAHKGVVSPLNQNVGAPSSAIASALAGADGSSSSPVASVGTNAASNVLDGALASAQNGAMNLAGGALDTADGADALNRDAQGNIDGIPGATTAALDAMDDSSLANWLGVIGVGAAAGIANYMLQRRGRGGTPNAAALADTVSNLPPGGNGDNIIDGEYRVVDERRLGRQTAGMKDGQNVTANKRGDAGPKKLPGAAPVTETARVMHERKLPSPRRALPDYSGPAPLSRREVGARQSVQSRVQPPGRGTIYAEPVYPKDVTPADVKKAQSITAQILAARRAGGAAKRRGVSPAIRGSSAPADDNGIFTSVLEAIRAAKLQKVPRIR